MSKLAPVARRSRSRLSPLEGLADVAGPVNGRDILRSISACPGPTIRISGERDSLFRLEELTFLTAAQDGVLQLIRGAGHAAHLDAPEAYQRALRRFALSINWR